MALLRRASALAAAAALAAACSDTVTSAPRDAGDAGDDLAPLDVPTSPPDAAPDVAPDAPPPPDDADPLCANGGTDRCLNYPPGPCPDLASGGARTVRFAGFARDHVVSCAGRQTSMGPDAVLPLTLAATSDVSITVNPGPGDSIVAALVPADACGQPTRELSCVNGSSSIGGIGVLRVSSVPAGRYALIVGTVLGAPVGVVTSVTPARPRAPGDLCPGVEVAPDGPPVTIDTRTFSSTADHGTSCGYNGQGSLGWVDAVARFTIREARDVTVNVAGDGMEDLNVEVTRVCGVAAYVIPGCDTGLPARRTLRNLPAGTYYAVVDYRPMARPDHTLNVTVTTAAPTPPGPAARCPGVALPASNTAQVDVDNLAPGDPPMCLTRARANAYFTFAAPSEPGDVLVNVATNAARSDVAFTLTNACGGDAVGACVSPLDRSANSVWGRYAGLTPGRTYTVEAATSAVGGQLSVREVRVPHVDPVAVTGNTTCETAYVLPPGGGIFTGTTDGSTAVASPFCATTMTGCAGSRGVLYRLDLTERRRVVAIMDGTGFDALLSLTRMDPCPGRTIRDQVACVDDWYSTDPQVDVTLDAGRYWIFAAGCGAAQSGEYRLDVAVLPP